MHPQDFWQALGSERTPWLFRFTKPEPVWWFAIAGCACLLIVLVLLRDSRRRWRWTPGHTCLVTAIILAFMFGIVPAVSVAIQPPILLYFVRARSLSDLSPYGVTLIIRSLGALSWLAVIGLAGVCLGMLGLWQDMRLLGLTQRGQVFQSGRWNITRPVSPYGTESRERTELPPACNTTPEGQPTLSPGERRSESKPKLPPRTR